MAEEIAPDSSELLGNFPQAFSHIGLVNAAWAISEAERHSRGSGGQQRQKARRADPKEQARRCRCCLQWQGAGPGAGRSRPPARKCPVSRAHLRTLERHAHYSPP